MVSVPQLQVAQLGQSSKWPTVPTGQTPWSNLPGLSSPGLSPLV